MIEPLIARWQALAPRERRLIGAGLAVIVLAIGYLVLFEPAWKGRRQLQRDLPALRAQVARMSTLAAEVQTLERSPQASGSASATRARLESSLRAAGLADKAEFRLAGERIDLRIPLVDFAAWVDWVDLAVREARVRVVDASVVRDPRSGYASVRVVFELPASTGP